MRTQDDAERTERIEKLAALLAEAIELLMPQEAPAAKARDRLLWPEEAAERLRVSKQWLYTHSDQLPFVIQLPSNGVNRQLRIAERALEEWIEEQGRGNPPPSLSRGASRSGCDEHHETERKERDGERLQAARQSLLVDPI